MLYNHENASTSAKQTLVNAFNMKQMLFTMKFDCYFSVWFLVIFFAYISPAMYHRCEAKYNGDVANRGNACTNSATTK